MVVRLAQTKAKSVDPVARRSASEDPHQLDAAAQDPDQDQCSRTVTLVAERSARYRSNKGKKVWTSRTGRTCSGKDSVVVPSSPQPRKTLNYFFFKKI